MNAQNLAKHAYSAASAPTRTSKGTEYEAVARITHRIQSSDADGTKGFPGLVEALHDNKKLWSIFAADVASENNGLPRELRARIFYLAEFTHHYTSKVMARQAPVGPLVEINTAVMRGLRGEAA